MTLFRLSSVHSGC